MSIVDKILRDRMLEERRNRMAAKNRYIPEALWKKLKAKRICGICKLKQKKRLQIHHKIPVSQGGSNDESNLIAICKDCHDKEHGRESTHSKENSHISP